MNLRFEPESWPHIERGLPEALYHGYDAMSASRLKVLDRATSLHLAHEIANPADSPAFAVGRALHSLVLTPHLWGRDFAEAPKVDRRTKEGKSIYDNFLATVGSKTVLTSDQADEVAAMSAAVMGNPDAAQVCRELEGQAELSLFAEVAGIRAKARLDRYVEVGGEGIIVDLKTTSGSASKDEFERSVWNFGYGLQCSFYLHMARACGLDPKHFVFVVVEKAAPHAVAVYRFKDEVVASFEPTMMRLVEKYRSYLSDGPKGYEGVTEIGIPSWALARIQAEENCNV